MCETLVKDKVAFVTGGSQGIGTAISLDLAENGADVCLTYRKHEDEAMEIASEIEKMGRKALAVHCDLASFEAAGKAVEACMEKFGHVDILVNNAGMNWDGVSWKMSEEQWDRVIEVNLKGYFNMVRHVVPGMRDRAKAEKTGGRIINVTSINGLRGKFGQSNYSASKAGIIGYTKALAKELGRAGITVNAVAPGLIETSMLMGLKPEDKEKVEKLALGEMALPHIGQPKDVAHLVTFLSSDNARHITGEVIKVDGGQYI
jgi:3-oxoacyl-[acyl-carrier protein] reductase